MSAVKLRRCSMYQLYVRRNPCEEWSFWTETVSIDALVYNIQVIEKYGWQWKVREAHED